MPRRSWKHCSSVVSQKYMINIMSYFDCVRYPRHSPACAGAGSAKEAVSPFVIPAKPCAVGREPGSSRGLLTQQNLDFG